MYNDVFLGKNREQEKDGPEVGIRIQEGRDIGIYVFLWLTLVIVWQTPTQHCKATILQQK